MGVLLRDVLKKLCGVNQWSYAVFWKSGCQNPKFLIWEECHHEPSSCTAPPPCTSEIENPEFPFGELESYWGASVMSSQIGAQSGERVQMLVSKMMTNNHIVIVGEGIVGRAAFTGTHEWILVNNYVGNTHPPEVLNEVHQQFSAGMQTVAVIPVPPHGVVQLGSSLAIMENMGFVDNVKRLILQLGFVPGALMSDSHGEKIYLAMPVSALSFGNCNVPNTSALLGDDCSQQSLYDASKFVGQPSSQVKQSWDNLTSTAFHDSNMSKPSRYFGIPCESKTTYKMEAQGSFRGLLDSGVFGNNLVPSNPDSCLKQQTVSYNSGPGPVISRSDANNKILTMSEQHILSGTAGQNHVYSVKDAPINLTTPHMRANDGLIRNANESSNNFGRESNALSNQCKSMYISASSAQQAEIPQQNVDSFRTEEVPLSSLVGQLTVNGIFSESSGRRYHSIRHTMNESVERKEKMDIDLFETLHEPLSQPDPQESVGKQFGDCVEQAIGCDSTITAISKNDDLCVQPTSGNDLYDIFGEIFKNKLLNGHSVPVTRLNAKPEHTDTNMSAFMKMQEASSDFYSVDNGVSDSGLFSSMGADNLLDAVVSRSHTVSKQSSDDNASCRTTLSKVSCSSMPGASLSYGCTTSDQLQREVFGLPKTLEKVGNISSSSFKSGCSKEDMGSSSQTTSIYGSQLSGWIGQNVKRDSSVSTAFSKKSDEVSKPNRKRLKPGENPRPRPKDRQMIQDRVKELREIVPNGAKCSIDALLERTIKHMLFLQSVAKHADKLKQTGDSKIISKDGGLILKDNFEGGATWAFEVGSQTMVCPIIVEDLNQPRQMLVEMLCEERGFFLEIAELIRGLGLTILKGVMEARNDKIWARFIVEANRDVTRMDIFMSLVRLLEQTVQGSTSSSNAMENNNMMIHHAFPQSTPITATGRPGSLQ